MRRRVYALLAIAALTPAVVSGCGSDASQAPASESLVPGFCTDAVGDYVAAVADKAPQAKIAEEAGYALSACSFETLDGLLDSFGTFTRLLAAATADPGISDADLIEAAREVTPTAQDEARARDLCTLVGKRDASPGDWPMLCDEAGVKEPKAPKPATASGTTTEAPPTPEAGPDPCADERAMSERFADDQVHPEARADAAWLLRVCEWENGLGPDPGPPPA